MVEIVGSVRIGMRSYLSARLLRSALRFTNELETIEANHDPTRSFTSEEEQREYGEVVERHQDLVVSAIVNSVGFMEAMVNECFTDAAEGEGRYAGGPLEELDDETIRLMTAWWEEKGEGFERTLTKYQMLLAFAGQAKLSTGEEPYQSAALAIRLRNTVVHYRPETVYADEEHAMARSLKTQRFPTNALTGEGNPWWPDKALGAGCARWCCTSVRALADRVTSDVGIKPVYQVVLGDGSTD